MHYQSQLLQASAINYSVNLPQAINEFAKQFSPRSNHVYVLLLHYQSSLVRIADRTSVNSNNEVVTNGGRMIAASAVSDSLEGAVAAAYKGDRTDIAHRAFRDANKAAEGLTYATADKIKAIVRSPKTPCTDSDIGKFGGLFDLNAEGFVDPLLFTTTDVDGETSKMPGLYHPDEYDTNGSAVGAVAKDAILPQKDAMKAGDVLLGLGSDGVHSNGFSLVRKIVERSGLSYTSPAPFDPKKLLGDVLLTPTRNMSSRCSKLALPSHLAAILDATSWPRLPMFDWRQKTGNGPVDDMSLTFNNGIGMVCIVPAEAADEISAIFQSEDEKVYTIGTLNNKSKESVIVKNSLLGLTISYIWKFIR
ncbi:hypothetical protein CANCADRAFT_2 [Tortispora caseinolytica NRRL Y-17796]|uniref:phosphoribosylformylglycinamidine cyclo-ligase n=1 Tax=Tortispora caseinolytica NRRL Y-17796 TaxID=767744 RepID=A0A1E4TI49_9ASCO|nr:hypothetical protein CANCADRAFT_2 [Tortispora caseinolytica NRRL Y-17796]